MFTESPQQQKTRSGLEQEEHEAPHVKEMSVSDDGNDAVRDLTAQRLTVAAVEIFTLFEQTIDRYKEKIDRQNRLLEIILKPHVKLHRTELRELHDCREEQPETNCCLEQEEPEPPQVKEEEEGEPPQVKEEEPDPPRVEEQGKLSTRQDSEVHHVKKQMDSESTKNAELETISMFDSDCVEDNPVSENQAEAGKILCEETYYETVLKKHKSCQKGETVPEKKSHACETCGKSFSECRSLLVHMRTHADEKPHSCETCEKSFKKKSNMVAHMKTHSGEKPYSCGPCGKRFTLHSTLFRHVRFHVAEKQYSCATCGKIVNQYNTVLHHMRTHTGDKLYSFETCWIFFF